MLERVDTGAPWWDVAPPPPPETLQPAPAVVDAAPAAPPAVRRARKLALRGELGAAVRELELGGPLELRTRFVSLLEELAGEVSRAAAAPGAAGATRVLILNRGATKLGDAPNVEKCGGFVVGARCAGGHFTPINFGCAKRKCTEPGCMRHATNERARRATLYLSAFDEPGRGELDERGDLAWGVVVLPFASELRPQLRDAGVLGAARKAAAVLVEAWRLGAAGIGGAGARMGLVEADHPEGDAVPSKWEEADLLGPGAYKAGEFRPHLNFLFPLAALTLDLKTERVSSLAKFKRWKVELDELERLRAAWSILQEVIKGRPLGRSAVVYYRYRATRRHKAHAARYFLRTFPAWAAAAQRVRYFGLFGARVCSRLAEVRAAKLRDREERARALEEGKRCPKCGGELHLNQHELEGLPRFWKRLLPEATAAPPGVGR